MAVLKDLIVHGPSRFINGIQTESLKADTIDAKNGYFKYLKAIDGDIENLSVEELLAQKATVVGLLDVKGELHTNTWTNSNIANIGGVFYISPTVISTSANVVIGGNEDSRTLTVSGGSFATTTVPTWNGTTESTSGWVIGSRVMVTGSVTYNNIEYPLGTCIGYISGALTSSGFTVQQISSEALESIFAITSTNSLSGTNIQISMYEIGPGNNNNQSNTASYKPVGILMTSYGMADKSTHIDIYGGVNAKNTSSKTSGMADPNVRIGYLSGLDSYTDSAGNTRQPTGWGIYTDNGYFKGVVVADSGSIGKFTINSKAIYSGTHDTWNKASTNGIFIGTNDTNYYVSGGPGANWWIRDDGQFQFGGTNGITYNGTTLSIPAANVSGALTAATIGADKLTAGTINSSILTSNNIVTDTITMGTAGSNAYIYVSKNNKSTAINSETKNWRIILGNVFGVSEAGYLTATSGKIGGFNLTTNAIYSTTNALGTTANNVYLGTEGISLGTTFKVTKTGVLTATSGTIGGWTVNSSYGLYTNSKTAATSTNAGILIQKDGAIYAGPYNSTSKACPFQVTSAGALTATGATFISDNTDLGSAITFKSNSGNNRSTIRVQDEIGSAFARFNDNNNLLNAIILYNDNSIYFSWLNSTNQQKYASFGDNAFIGVPSMFSGDMTITNGSLAITSGNLTMANGNISLSQGKSITSTSGGLLQESTAGNVVVGYGTYSNESGNLNLYAGNQINLIPQGSIQTSKPMYMNDVALHFSGEKGIYSDDQTGYLCRNFIYTGTTKCTALGNNSFATRIYGSSVWSNKSISTSDINLKENLKKLNKNTDNLILNLDTFEFTWKKDTEEYDGEKHFGFIAQNVKKEMENQSLNSSEYGLITDIGYGLGLSYNEFIPMLAHLCQSQQKEINELKQRIIELENKIK